MFGGLLLIRPTNSSNMWLLLTHLLGIHGFIFCTRNLRFSLCFKYSTNKSREHLASNFALYKQIIGGVSSAKTLPSSAWNHSEVHMPIHFSTKQHSWTKTQSDCRNKTLHVNSCFHACHLLEWSLQPCHLSHQQTTFSSLGYVYPYEKLFQTKPNYTFLTTFGCLCFPNLRPYNSHKPQFRSTSCTFLGYSPVHKGYRCRASDSRVYISRHVTFHKNIFPFKNITTKPVTPEFQP